MEGLEVYSVSETIRLAQGRFTRTDAKIARTLLASYPAAGLQSSKSLAKDAEVSVPSVLRFLAKLGFDKYKDFQNALRKEVVERESSPLHQKDTYNLEISSGSSQGRNHEIIIDNMRRTVEISSQYDFNKIVSLVSNEKNNLYLLGGRFTHSLATYFNNHLRLIRENTFLVRDDSSSRSVCIANIAKNDVVFVFDVRRYQSDTATFAQAVKNAGAKVILLTDPWLSPISKFSDLVLVSKVEGITIFDSLIPAMLLVEMLIAEIHINLGDEADIRMHRIDSIEKEFNG